LTRHQLVEPPHLVVVAAEQRQEAGLRAGRPLDAAEAQVLGALLQLVQVQDEIVTTGRRACRRRQLGRLEVREAERLQVAHSREARQRVDDADEPVAQQAQSSRIRIRSVLS